MARQQRNDVDYFPHPVIHGRKMFFIRSKYGIAGYGIWFIILEELGKASYHYLDLQDEKDMMYLSAQCGSDQKLVLDIIEDLVKLESFDSELWEQRILWNQSFVDSIADAYKKRQNECISKDQLIQILSAKGRLNGLLITPKAPLITTIPPKLTIEQTPDSNRAIIATQKIALFFGVSEINQSGSYIKIGNFVRYQEAQGQIEHLSRQFTAYKAVKEAAPKFKHKWNNYIGDPDKSYENGVWNELDWTQELKKIEVESTTKDSKSYA